jgi:hypothetical protein
MDDGKQPAERPDPPIDDDAVPGGDGADGSAGPAATGSGAGRSKKAGAGAGSAKAVELPSLRDELRTAAQYGIAGRWANRRREKIRTEIERNRQGGHKIPTWVLGLILVAVVVGWVLLIVLN